MTHIGRPKDKKTGKINCSPGESVDPVVTYLEHKLHMTIEVPSFAIHPETGIVDIDSSIQSAVQRLRDYQIGALYLPNTRWFQGEETDGPSRAGFAKQLSKLADIFVNDAFGSWQSHASTVDITDYLPSCAGFLLQDEIKNLGKVLNPARPFLAIVAGAKYDTKIGPVKELYERVDHLILGGVMYNTYLCAKYGIEVAGVPKEDIDLASELVRMDEKKGKIVELPLLVESDRLEERDEAKTRMIAVNDFRKDATYPYILDAHPDAFHENTILDIINSAKTVLVNAVMGFMPHFPDGTRALYEAVDRNHSALKLYGGGDTLEGLKYLCPGVYLKGLDDPSYYYFTGGGAVLKALEKRSPYEVETVKRLLKS